MRERALDIVAILVPALLDLVAVGLALACAVVWIAIANTPAVTG